MSKLQPLDVTPSYHLENIRLPGYVVEIIIKSFERFFLKNDELVLFGSRANPLKKGGDIDLCIYTSIESYEQAEEKKMLFLINLKNKIGEQKIDVVLRLKNSPRSEYIEKVIANEGVRLK